MPGRREIEYDEFLPDPGEFLRVRISTARGVVLAFTIQYETTVAGRRVAVVRYDAQHEKPHRDTLNRRGEVVDKLWLGLSNAEALDFGKRDLLSNWRRYKAPFLE